MATPNDEWELSKENIQPLQQGRKPEVLKVALTINPEDLILQQRQAFEKELRTYTGTDPLSVWCKYIKWVEQNFPKGGKDGHIEQLIQQCISILKDRSEYYDDERFIEICLKFANIIPKQNEFYNYMYSHKIGCKSAMFFIAWSWELEYQNNINKAHKVLKEGINRKAEPLGKLKSYLEEFEMRIASKIMSNSEHTDTNEEPYRSAFSVLKPQKKRNLAPVLRTGDAVLETNKSTMIIGRQQPLPKNNVYSGKVPFKIYNAENIAPSLPIQSENPVPFILHSDSSKENEKKPSKWNKVKAKQMPSITRMSENKDPGFKLHCDEVAPPTATPRSVPRASNILRARQDCPAPPLALFEAPDPMKKPMYDKEKVYGGAEEFSFEEIRAASWFKKEELKEKEGQCEKQLRLLHEKDEQIAKLMYEVQLLKNKESNATNLSDMGKDKNKDGVIDKNLSLYSQAPYFQSNKSESKSNYDSNTDSIQRALFPNTKHTSTFREASYIVRDFYNDTFALLQDEPSCTTSDNIFQRENFQNSNALASNNKAQIFHDPLKGMKNDAHFEQNDQADQRPSITSYEQKLPFKPFQDPTEIITITKENLGSKHLVSSHSVQKDYFYEDAKEDVENIPPKEYIQETSKRELSGILQPSKDIMFIPLELQEQEGNSSEEEGECLHAENTVQQNETLIPPCNTEQFVAGAHLSSTPHTQLKRSQKLNQQDEEENISKSFVPPNPLPPSTTFAQNKQLGKTDFRTCVKDQSTFPVSGVQLSVIMESSRECYKSSSSSGSSGSTTKLSTLEQCYSHEKSNIQRHLSKTDVFKERQSIVLRSGSSVINKRESIMKEQILQNKENSLIKPVAIRPNDSKNANCKDALLQNKEKEFQIHVSDINPFDANLNTKILKSLDLPSDYHSKLDVSKNPVKNLEVYNEIKFPDFTCVVIRLIREGAFGKIYEAEKQYASSQKIHSNTKVALKVCRNANDWEFYICYSVHKRLQEINNPPDVKLSVMEINAAKRCSDSIVLVSEFSQNGTLLDLVNMYKQKNENIPETIIMYLTFEMLHIVSKIHECKIIHGDIKPDNILIRNVSNFNIQDSFSLKTTFLKFIDFGRAIDLTAFERGICFKTILKDGCIEMKENKSWAFQIDWYGLLSCIHVLLFSEYMKVKQNPDGKWTIEKKFKRYWDQKLWVPLFDELLNIPSCYQEPNIAKYTHLIESKLKANAQVFKMHSNRLASFYVEK
ncbi:hypothetical protein TNCT_393361 [Trichonephila clavata]|uniref:Mitotic checkpoint serine/threonine-protein kinase BUB1 beta n=1 Tax=Trichonephila clavata TaxID=2740835 RepID=A0A8X6HET3_TRICU|nr:hypothetical protein TNCT_393361 [Trichonephila clavata]